jgi:lipopolysaccharide heptosyltransferase II
MRLPVMPTRPERSSPGAAIASAWRAARRLLVVRLDNMGDVLMATPAIAALRAGLPHARIGLLASPSGAALAPFLPDIDEAIPFVAPWVKVGSDEGAGATGRAEAALVARLVDARFDAAVIFTTCTQSALPAALVCRMAGIPLRLAHSRENPYALLTDWVPETDVIADGMRHEVARQLALVASVGFRVADTRLRFTVDAASRHALAAKLAHAGMAPRTPYLVVHPGATAESRRYPAGRFAAAAQAIGSAAGLTIVLSGGPDDASLVREMAAAMTLPAISLVGDLGLGELAALIEGARLLVANNSGPAHLAAALATPVVDLYALTNPQHTPWQVPARVLNHPVPCRNCLKSRCPQGHHDCLLRVSSEAVTEAALELLSAAPTRRQHGTALAAASP